ncbi:MAG: hypothetical protein WC408_04835 [Candidatus Micrarchaeia archaeon]
MPRHSSVAFTKAESTLLGRKPLFSMARVTFDDSKQQLTIEENAA